MWAYLFGRPLGHLGYLMWALLGTSGQADVGTSGHIWAPFGLSDVDTPGALI